MSEKHAYDVAFLVAGLVALWALAGGHALLACGAGGFAVTYLYCRLREEK